MLKKLVNILIFIFIFTLYIITFLMIYDEFKDRKLKSMEKSALRVFEKEIKKEETQTIVAEEEPSINYGQFTILGKMDIPEIGLSTVILKEQSYASMNVGAVKTYGVELNTEGGFIISGHNFKGRSVFLYNIKNLKEGSKIYITDIYGDIMEYTVYNVMRNVDPMETSYYKEYEGYHVVITTCENGGKSRIVVMAKVEG